MSHESTSSLPNEAAGATALVDVLVHHAEQRPDTIAMRDLGGGEGDGDSSGGITLTYAALDAQARSIAVELAAHCRPGDPVLLLVEPGVEFVTAFFGCLYAGVVPVPLAARINQAVAATVGRILHDAEARVVLASPDVAASARTMRLLSERQLVFVETTAVTADPGGWRRPPVTGADIALLQYTSGTTHAPKGVMVTHDNLLRNLRTIRHAFGFDPETVMASWLPPHHDMGLIGTILTPVYLGIPTILMHPVSFIRQPVKWLRAITDHGATISGGPNFSYDLCTRRVTEAEKDGLDLSGWRVAFNGAEPVRAATLRAFEKAFAPVGFDSSSFLPCYGLAEATLLVAGQSRADGATVTRFASDRLQEGTAVAAGVDGSLRAGATDLVACQILPQVEVRVVGPDGQPVDDGSAGEIWVAGGSVVPGYHNRPEESARVFTAFTTQSPPHGPYLRTGDLGFRIGDQLYVRGRIKDVVVIRGQNHYPDDIEATVRAGCPAITGRVAAFGVDRGDDEALVVWYESRRDLAPALALETAISGRRAVSQTYGVDLLRILAVAPGTIPVTTSGKIRRAECARSYLAGGYAVVADDPLHPGAGDDGDGVPQGPLHQVRDIVARVAGIPVELVDPSRTPAELSFDSLKAVELQNALEQAFGVRPTLVDLLGVRTLAELFAGLTGRVDEPSSAVVDPGAPFALSYGQRAVWFQGRLATDPGSLNLSRAVEFSAAVDIPALAAAARGLGVRHPALRTRFIETEGRVIQQIDTEAPVVLGVEDAAEWSDARLAEVIEAEAHAPFDRPPLLRMVLYHGALSGSVLQLTAHHSVMDLWSLAILIEDLVSTYSATSAAGPVADRSSGATDLDHPAEFVHSQQSYIDSDEGRRREAEWRDELATLPPLRLPTDRARPTARTFRGAAHSFRLEPSLYDRIRAFAAHSGVNASAVLFAGYATVLARYAGQQRFALGFVHSGRVSARWSDLVGYLVNPLPIGIDLDGDPDFRTLVRSVNDAVLTTSDGATLPFGRLAMSAVADTDRALNGLLSATFALQHSPGTSRLGLAPLVLNHAGRLGDWAGLPVTTVPVPQHACYFDLSLYVAEHDGAALATIEYSTDLFERETIEVLSETLTALLDNACASPDERVSVLPLLPDRRREQVARQWNDTTTEYGTDDCVHQLIESQARRTPDLPAVIGERERLSYRQLNEAANRLAHRLIRLGAAAGSTVGILMPRSPTSLVSVLAVLKTGAAYVPLDPSYPLERLRFIMANSGAPMLVTDPVRAMDFPAVSVIDPADPTLAEEPPHDPSPRAHPDDTAYVVYTSGSTGHPQGVLGLHRGITNRQRSVLGRFPFGPNEVGSHKTSLAFFDSGGEMFLPLCAGAPVVVISEDVGRDPARLVDTLSEHRVTRLVAVPSLLRAILDVTPDVGARLSMLRYCHSSGEALTPDIASRWRDALPGCVLVDLYGASEISADVTLDVVTDPAQVGSVGRPIGNTRVYVLDERMALVPPRFPGEVYIGGVGLARGYLGRPDLTAAKFVPDPFGCGDRLFRTGDRGRWRHDGRLEYVGRVDHQVKVRGFRIELGEVETALRTHPGVRAAMAAVTDAPPGHERLLVAAVVPEPGHRPAAMGDGVPGADRVADWRQLYDRLYADAGVGEEHQVAIWTSSYTGEPFTAVEVGEWTDHAVSRIREFGPREVLEIGCGTGNLVLALASECERYTATDFSTVGLDVLRERLTTAGFHAELLLREANDFTGLTPGSYDTVVLHSVAQYLPDHTYLRSVLTGAVDMTRDGGRVYIGDVRDLDLFEAFHTSVEMARAATVRVPVSQLRDRIARRQDEDEELVLAQDFFALLPRWLPRVSRVETFLRRGRHVNELSTFRYDVVLHVTEAAPAPAPAAEPLVLDWHRDELDVTALRSALRNSRSRPVEVRDVPNARLSGAAAAVEWLGARPANAVAVPPEHPAATDALDPEDGWSIGQGQGRATAVVPATSRRPYAMDLRFWPVGAGDAPVAWTSMAILRTDWSQLANNPMRIAARRYLLSDLRRYLRERLPEFMVPMIELVGALPTTATGKVSRQQLASTWSRSTVGVARSAPGPGWQATVSAIWHDILGVRSVGIDENFFDVGGNSLSLAQVHIRLQELTGREFPMVELYEHTTIRKVAEFLINSVQDNATPAEDDPDTVRQRRRQAADRRQLMRERTRGEIH